MAILFDTLKLAQRLEAAGMSSQQAQGTAEALAEGLTGTVATAADLREVELRLRGEIHEAEGRLRSEIAGLAQRLAETEARLLRLMITQALAIIGAVAAIVGLAAALTHLFH